ncbi:hypothetical protein EVAR_45018_1 [Eumeta japonica]|uniref:HTH CENPB-type domain-containing protein n=1 Tax=Eumeta variegata TaxID=151549 RepID=A0A4C1XDH8_EUMVA|nr:hypothetical protein EVAR_45018_1 [Eumeta japonica]
MTTFGKDEDGMGGWRFVKESSNSSDIDRPAAASMFDFCHASWLRYKNKKIEDPGSNRAMGYNSATKVCSEDQENKLSSYLIKTADIYFGFTPKAVRRLAYDLAIKCNLKKPESWDRDKMAGTDWLSAFLKRNPELSI